MYRKTKWSIAVAVVLVGLVLLWGFLEEVDWHALRDSLESLDPGLLLVMVVVLPIFGFSIGLVYLVVGAVFGGWLGLTIVAGATAVHLLGSHWIARSFLRVPVQRFLARKKHRLPELPAGEEWAISLMTALVPGLPYVVRNYLLALSEIPLRTYFWICWPVYVARSGVAIFLGDYSGDITVRRMAVLALVLAVKVGICAWLIHRLRRRRKVQRQATAPTTRPSTKSAL